MTYIHIRGPFSFRLVIYAVNTDKQTTENLLQILLEKCIMHILELNLEIKINHGHPMLFVRFVWNIYDNGHVAPENQ